MSTLLKCEKSPYIWNISNVDQLCWAWSVTERTHHLSLLNPVMINKSRKARQKTCIQFTVNKILYLYINKIMVFTWSYRISPCQESCPTWSTKWGCCYMLSKCHSFFCQPVNIRGSGKTQAGEKKYTKMIIWIQAWQAQGIWGKNYQENIVNIYCI